MRNLDRCAVTLLCAHCSRILHTRSPHAFFTFTLNSAYELNSEYKKIVETSLTYIDRHRKSWNKRVSFHVHRQNCMRSVAFAIIWRPLSNQIDSMCSIRLNWENPMGRRIRIFCVATRNQKRATATISVSRQNDCLDPKSFWYFSCRQFRPTNCTCGETKTTQNKTKCNENA